MSLRLTTHESASIEISPAPIGVSWYDKVLKIQKPYEDGTTTEVELELDSYHVESLIFMLRQ